MYILCEVFGTDSPNEMQSHCFTITFLPCRKALCKFGNLTLKHLNSQAPSGWMQPFRLFAYSNVHTSSVWVSCLELSLTKCLLEIACCGQCPANVFFWNAWPQGKKTMSGISLCVVSFFITVNSWPSSSHLHLCCCPQDRIPFVVPERVPWRMMYNTLNSKFVSEVQTKHNLDQYNQHFLAQKIFDKPDFADDFSNMLVSWSQFNKVCTSICSVASCVHRCTQDAQSSRCL